MPQSGRPYKRRSSGACEQREHPERFCPRCGLRFTARNPRADKKRHCALCEHELTTGRIVIGFFEGV